MRIKLTIVLLLLSLSFLQNSVRAEHKHSHGDQMFHAFRLELDAGDGEHGGVATWDVDGWIGGDINKLWLKSEGEQSNGELEHAEFWVLYSRNVSTFWDMQIGVRHDTQPTSLSYLTLGVHGLTPYYFETEAHLFVSDEGDVSARLHQENDLLVTQRLILQPYIEINVYAQDIKDQDIGSGFSTGEIGLLTRYEFTRKFAPYIDIRYKRKFGETSAIAQRNGQDKDDVIKSIGLRFMF